MLVLTFTLTSVVGKHLKTRELGMEALQDEVVGATAGWKMLVDTIAGPGDESSPSRVSSTTLHSLQKKKKEKKPSSHSLILRGVRPSDLSTDLNYEKVNPCFVCLVGSPIR